MSYHEDLIIDDLVATIISDGNGSQCGLAYDARLRAARNDDLGEFRAACRIYNKRRVMIYHYPSATDFQRLIAAENLLAYYKEHLTELGGEK